MEGQRWSTTDLCLDVWCGVGREAEVLDEDELEEALRRGWVSEATAARARSHAGLLLRQAAAGDWPPPHVHEWTLERVRERHG